jgi:hypothetical protein
MHAARRQIFLQLTDYWHRIARGAHARDSQLSHVHAEDPRGETNTLHVSWDA